MSVKECGHKWECGCDKEICDNCKEIAENDDEYMEYDEFCEDENCKTYYYNRKDNCDCCDRGCPYCKAKGIALSY